MRHLTILAALIFSGGAPLGGTIALGQTDSVTRRTAPPCWRGKPVPRCGMFWLTEVSGAYSYATTKTHYRVVYPGNVVQYDRPDVSSRIVWTIGPMFNTSPLRAVGGTLSAGIVNAGSGSRSKLGGGGGWMTCSIDLGALTLAVLAEVAAHAGAF